MRDDADLLPQVVLEQALFAVTAAADAGDWDQWVSLFAEDAVVDYRAAGGDLAPPAESVPTLRANTTGLAVLRHHVTNVRVTAHDDTSVSGTALFIAAAAGPDGPAALSGGSYRVEVRRRDDRWLVVELVASLDWLA